MRIEIHRETLTSAARAVPVRVDPRAVAYVGVGAGMGALAAAAAPVAVCTACVVGWGAIEGAAAYGVTRALSWRRRGVTA